MDFIMCNHGKFHYMIYNHGKFHHMIYYGKDPFLEEARKQ